MRVYALILTEHTWFKYTVVAIIIANSITLGLETYPAMMMQYGPTLLQFDSWFLTFFVVELLLKLFAQGLGFARRPWNWFDTIIVLTSLLPMFGNLSALRALRILRLLSIVPAFQQITEALIKAASGAAAVFGLLGLVLSVFALLSSKLFGASVPHLYGNFHTSLLTHFQMMVFDNWRDIVNSTVEQTGVWAQWYIMGASTITGFILVSLLIGVIIDSLQIKRNHDDIK